MTVELTRGKIIKIKKIVALKAGSTVRIRSFAEILDFLVSCCAAVNYGWSHTKTSERAKYLALQNNGNDYNDLMIPDRIKTSGHNRKQPTLVLPYFSKNEKICAAKTLETYLDKTKNSRDNVKNLFISFKRPFKPVSTQTLSRWVKNSLKTSGIDTSIFSAHSTRHASTSAAKRQGIDIDTLRKTAGWTKASRTFARFYDLQLSVDDRAFANAVLKS
ncbi:hypothetical protein QAD02_006281 [Eretmocerus hayati]|uniref:Uncharacterized protein n=1 Tax=Eretmocerus hayati TaxID=131215 RepID=A0ACC2N0U3_9HYME|nr:hypothetical protein QAD02_006281 [Eretmocerus hayati]